MNEEETIQFVTYFLWSLRSGWLLRSISCCGGWWLMRTDCCEFLASAEAATIFIAERGPRGDGLYSYECIFW